jgi:hypothetical protein
MPGGRFALSRTCEGPAEYSGRGGRQLYTHALILDAARLAQSGHRPFAIYRDALALGYFHYRAEPDSVLQPVPLSTTYALPPEESGWADRARDLNAGDLGPWRSKLASGGDVKLPFAGDRIALAECLLGPLEPETVLDVSFTTSLQPSAARPYRLTLLGGPN